MRQDIQYCNAGELEIINYCNLHPQTEKTRYTIPSVSKIFINAGIDAPDSDARAAKVIWPGPCSNDSDDDERLAEAYEKRMFPSPSVDASSIRVRLGMACRYLTYIADT